MEFPLDQPQVTIGRHSSNALVISDGMASRSHCVIEKVGDTFRLRDLNSSNGTRLNGQIVRSAVMANGDVISIGRTTLKLIVPGAPLDELTEEDLVEAPQDYPAGDDRCHQENQPKANA